MSPIDSHDPRWKTASWQDQLPICTVIRWQDGAGFSAKTIEAIKTKDGWHRTNVEYRHQIYSGAVGPKVEIPKDKDQSEFGLVVEGVKVGDSIQHLITLEGLPPGAVVEGKGTGHGVHVKKADNLWYREGATDPKGYEGQFLGGMMRFGLILKKV